MDFKKFYDVRVIILTIALLLISSFLLGKFGSVGVVNFSCPEKPDYGFPFSVMTHCLNMKGKVIDQFRSISLIIDLIVWYVISLIVVLSYNKFKKYRSTKKEST